MTASVLYGLVLFSAVAHAIWNSLVKSAGDRTLTMVLIRFTGLVLGLAALPFVDWSQPESWKELVLRCAFGRGGTGVVSRDAPSGTPTEDATNHPNLPSQVAQISCPQLGRLFVI
jgi:hypothetical protein